MKPPIKILHVVNIPFVLPYFLGDQIEFLKSNDIITTIACTESSKLDEFVKQYDIEKFEVDIVRKIDVVTDLKSVYQLMKFIRKEKFDYVIGHTPKGALLAMIASWLAGTKSRIYFRHGLVFETSKGLKRKLMVFLERLTSRLATQIVSVSESVLSYSVGHKLGSKQKNILLNKGTCNGVDINKYTRNNNLSLKSELGIKESNIVVGYVGRLVNDKGINELAEAWKLLLREHNNITLLLVGPFEERDTLSDEIKLFLENQESIIVTNLVQNSQPYYNIMDMFVLPSYREGFPTVVLEASSMELPIITTRSTGCIDSIQEDVTGVFVDIDAIDIKNKIEFYIENPEVKVEHGENGRKWIIENFKQEVVWNTIKEKIYNK
ncbi:glycosyltransferase family 4 protein [Myroides sp. M-43]|uniref:glycosyltransferase family 4 protein n=1 Tax=Myroides oncorhynchi TaxID=2893756 RepID=UPI001E4CC006|nr:glycosyltransferase family 4 protein [Myroides oncorhynchi]MCC9043605.1 glycosyltransferase family 4 protein [Myroides oncorhynchi]